MAEGTTDTAEQQSEGTPPEQSSPEVAALRAELEKVKAASRKWEARSKENLTAAQQAEAARLAALPEAERAVEQARTEARQEVLLEVASARVDDAVRIAAAGRAIDVDAILEGLDRRRFITADAQPDTPAIAAWIDKVAPKPEDETRRVLDLGQGARGSTTALNDDDGLLKALKGSLGIK
jgi:dsDNA-specific endonuclease/ATPase MutS2